MMTYEVYMKNQQSFYQEGMSYTPVQPSPSPNSYVHTNIMPSQAVPNNVHFSQVAEQGVGGRMSNHKGGNRNRIQDGNVRGNESHVRPRYVKENSRERREAHGGIGKN